MENNNGQSENVEKAIPIVTLTLIGLMFIFPFLQHFITSPYVVEGVLKNIGDMPYKAGLSSLKLIGNGLNLGLGAVVLLFPLEILSTAVFSIIIGAVLGAFIELMVVKRKSRIIVSVLIVITVLTYFVSLDTYLSRTSDVNTKTIHLNNDYLFEIQKIEGNKHTNELWLEYLIKQNSSPELIKSIDIKIIKNHKIYLPKGGEDLKYFSVFEYIEAPFIIRIGKIKLQDYNGSNTVVLSVYKDIEVKKFYQDNLPY